MHVNTLGSLSYHKTAGSLLGKGSKCVLPKQLSLRFLLQTISTHYFLQNSTQFPSRLDFPVNFYKRFRASRSVSYSSTLSRLELWNGSYLIYCRTTGNGDGSSHYVVSLRQLDDNHTPNLWPAYPSLASAFCSPNCGFPGLYGIILPHSHLYLLIAATTFTIAILEACWQPSFILGLRYSQPVAVYCAECWKGAYCCNNLNRWANCDQWPNHVMHGITGNVCKTQHCSHENATTHFLSISVDPQVSYQQYKSLSFGMETQKMGSLWAVVKL